MTRGYASTLTAAVHASRSANDDAVDEEEHPHREQAMDPSGSRGGERYERPHREHYDGCDYAYVHGEESLTLYVTTGKFRQSVMRKLQKNFRHHRWGGELTF